MEKKRTTLLLLFSRTTPCSSRCTTSYPCSSLLGAASYLYFAQAVLKSDPTLVITLVQHALIVPKIEAALALCTYDKTRLRIPQFRTTKETR